MKIPPMQRYSHFWDAGLVLHHIKQLGDNNSLSLKWMTIKTAIVQISRPVQIGYKIPDIYIQRGKVSAFSPVQTESFNNTSQGILPLLCSRQITIPSNGSASI